MINSLDFVFSIVILIFSVVIHEVSHGFSAYKLGDKTAFYEGRLTLNPLKHLELFGSFILPTISYIFGGFILGWAKPVPVNVYNLKNQRWGEAIVSFAGPLSNILIALFFGLAIRFFGPFVLTFGLMKMFVLIVITNIILALFNLIPIPPLDGSKILFSFFPRFFYNIRREIEVYGSFLLIFFIFFLWQYFLPVIGLVFYFITGISGF